MPNMCELCHFIEGAVKFFFIEFLSIVKKSSVFSLKIAIICVWSLQLIFSIKYKIYMTLTFQQHPEAEFIWEKRIMMKIEEVTRSMAILCWVQTCYINLRRARINRHGVKSKELCPTEIPESLSSPMEAQIAEMSVQSKFLTSLETEPTRYHRPTNPHLVTLGALTWTSPIMITVELAAGIRTATFQVTTTIRELLIANKARAANSRKKVHGKVNTFQRLKACSKAFHLDRVTIEGQSHTR